MKAKSAKSFKALVADHATVDHVERIRQRAYELWESSGCPQGCEEEHWLQAERELSVLWGSLPAAHSAGIHSSAAGRASSTA